MGSFSLLWQGLRFGMLLQLAVGPVCLMVINVSVASGLCPALELITAVTLVDALYIALSTLSAASLMRKPFVRRWARVFGGAVLVLFGLQTALAAVGVTLLPGLRWFDAASDSGLFIKGLVLTLSNPLTILFWSGLLSAKVAENRWQKRELLLFSLGCVSATAVFLTAVAALGGLLSGRMPSLLVSILNAMVGIALVFLGLRLSVQKEPITSETVCSAASEKR